MAAIDEVISWAKTRPPWQGDAIRRLLQVGENALDPAQHAEILALAKADLKLARSPEGLSAVLPEPGMFSGAPAVAESVKLLSIDNVQDVNIIRAGASQTFGESGITIVYGSNGAGKSGYVRVLKLACQARDKEDFILPNVFEPHILTSPPTATLRIYDSKGPKNIQWKQGVAPDPILTNINVFDGRCARVITDQRNHVSYLPYGCEVFPKLTALVQYLKEQLASEVKAPMPVQDVSILEGTPSSDFLRLLSPDTTKGAIEAATAWTQDDETALASQQDLMLRSNATRVAEEIARLKRTKQRVTDASEAAIGLDSTCTEISNSTISTVLAELSAAKAAHAFALAQRQGVEPLKGVGSTNQWQILYQAAKAYSEEVAYIGETFPKTDDAMCVLCQQPLGPDAVKRFGRFKMFVENATNLALGSARNALAALCARLDKIVPLSGAALGAVCDEVDRHDADAARVLRTFHEGVASRKSAATALLMAEGTPGNAEQLQDWPASPANKLDAVSASLEARIVVFVAASNPQEHASIAANVRNLRARKSLSARNGDVETYVDSLRRNRALNSAIDSLNTNRITREGTEIVKKVRTPELLKRLEKELEDLGATTIPISVKPVGDVGETTHEMFLQGASAMGRNPVSKVLSEGEGRVVAIAGFLAELNLVPNTNAIVFDDPVSSLDHVYTGKIAERLVREGANRQVIIFTHSIAFLAELDAAASYLDELGTHVDVTVHTLRSSGTVAGITTNGLPWHAEKVGPRVAYLQTLVTGIKPEYHQNMDVYNKEAAYIYGLLREAWEACIEEELINGAVCRHRNSVETRRLKGVEVTDPDVGQINAHMSKTSTWMTGHAKSKALHHDRPAPAEVLADIEALRQFADAVRKRRTATEKRR